MSGSYPKMSDGSSCPCCGAPVEPSGILLDLSTNTLTYGGKRARVAAAEAEMMAVVLAAYPGDAPKERIKTAIWGVYDAPLTADHMVAVYASHLRAAFKEMGLSLVGVYGRGYRVVKGPNT